MLVHNKGNYTRHAAGVALIPGANHVESADFEKFVKHPLMKKLVDSGEIVTQKSIKDLNVDEAIDLVKDTYSIEYLKTMKSGETRKGVLSAIDTQIKSILGENDEDSK